MYIRKMTLLWLCTSLSRSNGVLKTVDFCSVFLAFFHSIRDQRNLFFSVIPFFLSIQCTRFMSRWVIGIVGSPDAFSPIYLSHIAADDMSGATVMITRGETIDSHRGFEMPWRCAGAHAWCLALRWAPFKTDRSPWFTLPVIKKALSRHTSERSSCDLRDKRRRGRER